MQNFFVCFTQFQEISKATDRYYRVGSFQLILMNDSREIAWNHQEDCSGTARELLWNCTETALTENVGDESSGRIQIELLRVNPETALRITPPPAPPLPPPPPQRHLP